MLTTHSQLSSRNHEGYSFGRISRGTYHWGRVLRSFHTARRVSDSGLFADYISRQSRLHGRIYCVRTMRFVPDGVVPLLSDDTSFLCMLQIVSMSFSHPSIHSLFDPCDLIDIAISLDRCHTDNPTVPSARTP